MNNITIEQMMKNPELVLNDDNSYEEQIQKILESTLALDFIKTISTNRPITHAELIIVDLLKAIDILIDDSRKSPLVESEF